MAVGESMSLLKEGKVPERYRRNIGTVGMEGQIKLLNSRVAIVGAGGLGGLVIELLARMGVGYLRIIDGDTFADHNLNRQVLSTETNLGLNKALIAVSRVQCINSDVQAEAESMMLDEMNAELLVAGVDVIVDCLDNFPARLLVARTARKLGIPLVHAAIAGFTGQVTTIMTGDKGLESIYKVAPGVDRGIETVLGNPAATPALAAAFQVQEIVKVLTGVGEPLRNKLLYFDTEVNIFELINLA